MKQTHIASTHVAGEKQRIACVRHYLAVATDLPASRAGAAAAAAAANSGRAALVQVFDLRNKLLAGSLQVKARLNLHLPETTHSHIPAAAIAFERACIHPRPISRAEG